MKNIIGTELISKHKYGYQIYTLGTIKTRKYYASCKTLIEALMIRDYGMVNNWKPFPKPWNSKTGERYIHKEDRGYSIKKTIKGKQEYFGVFDRLEDAISERDLLIRFDWDLEVLCECCDEGNSFLDGVKPLKSTFTKYTERRDIIPEKMWDTAKYDKLYCGGLD